MNISPQSYDAYQLLHNGILALSRAEQQGICIDVDYIQRKKQQLTNKIEYLEEEFKDSQFFKDWQKSSKTKINIYSGQQLSNFLYNTKKIKITKTTKTGKGSTDVEALQQLNIPELDPILRIAKLKKVRDTYLGGFEREQVDGILHPFFNLNTVITYRSSSDSPNFQNIPIRDDEAMKICRRAIKCRPGNQLIEFDFKGAEVRVSVCYNKDPTLLKYIEDPTTDMHGDLAQQLFKLDHFDKHLIEYDHLRQAAKNGFVFPQFYGSYYKNCATNLANKWCKLPQSKWKSGQGVAMPGNSFLSDYLISQGLTSYNKFTEHVQEVETDFWKNRFFKYAQWKDRWYAKYQKRGYIDFLTGFRASGLMSRNDVINYPVQGAAFHCLLWSLIKLDAYIIRYKLKSRIIGQIHDSIVVDADPSESELLKEIVSKIICQDLPNAWDWIIVPIEIDTDLYQINGSWADKIKK